MVRRRAPALSPTPPSALPVTRKRCWPARLRSGIPAFPYLRHEPGAERGLLAAGSCSSAWSSWLDTTPIYRARSLIHRVVEAGAMATDTSNSTAQRVREAVTDVRRDTVTKELSARPNRCGTLVVAAGMAGWAIVLPLAHHLLRPMPARDQVTSCGYF